jgi:hypothetical protein
MRPLNTQKATNAPKPLFNPGFSVIATKLTFYESSLQHTAAEASVSEASSTILRKQYVH